MYRSVSDSPYRESQPAQTGAISRGNNADRIEPFPIQKVRSAPQSVPQNAQAHGSTTVYYSSRPPASQNRSQSGGYRPQSGGNRKRKKKRRMNGGALLLLVLTLMLLGLIVVLARMNGCELQQCSPGGPVPPQIITEESYIPRGVTVSGVAIGDMQVQQARAIVENQLRPRLGSIAVTIQTEHFNSVLRAEDLGAYFDVESTLHVAAAGNRNKSYDAPLLIDETVLAETIAALQEDVPNAAHDATVRIELDDETNRPRFKYTDGVAGVTIQTSELAADICGKFAAGTLSFTVTPKMVISQPNITREMLEAERTMLNTNIHGDRNVPFITEYRPGRGGATQTEAEIENNMGRDHNITKAANTMNVIHLTPGQQWSFNDSTGKRDEKNGWALANAIANDKTYVKEYGGGVCQVATTIFNALITSGIEVTTRRPHSIPSDYVPVGRDATVDYPRIDFRFRNNTSSDIWVFVYVRPQDVSLGGSKYKKNICVEVYGRALPPGHEYRLRSVENEPRCTPEPPEIVEDKNKPFGSKDEITRNPHDYINITWFVDLYINGEFECNVFKYDSIYQAIRERRSVGIMTPSPPPPTATPRPTDTPKPTPESVP
ncbi:MAG: VanW family protein [Clostridiales bacterium]|nr:VanW family protein [Clostridiales bacterium]